MTRSTDSIRRVSVAAGIVGATLLLALYLGALTLASSFEVARADLVAKWPWLLALFAGFGVQVGLLAHVRPTARRKEAVHGATPAVAATGGVSTATMLACCAHHAAEFLPILGLTAAAAFLGAYQTLFLAVGIVSNVIGITWMLRVIARHGLYFAENRWLDRAAAFDLRRLLQLEFGALAALLVVAGVLAVRSTAAEAATIPHAHAHADAGTPIVLTEQDSAGDGLWVTAGGVLDRKTGVIEFTLQFTTHSGSMDFAVDRIATLAVDSVAFAGRPTWSGSPPGGHHRSGTLRFAGIPNRVGTIKLIELTLADGSRLRTRQFAWQF